MCHGWVATSENRSKIGDFAPPQSVWTQISGTRGLPPPIIFARIVRPMNALQLCRWQFSHTKKLCSRLSSSEVLFYTENGRYSFLSPPVGGLGATYDDHLGFIGKRVVDFVLVLSELFFTRCYCWGTTSEYRFKIGDFAPTGASWPTISDRRGRPHQPFFFSEN